MSPTVDLIASELRLHRVESRVAGALTCLCGWDGVYPDLDSQHDRHVAEAILNRITQREHVDTLTAINERLILPRIGLSMMREMDRDIVTLQAAAATLTALLAPNWTGERQHPETTR